MRREVRLYETERMRIEVRDCRKKEKMSIEARDWRK